MAVGSRIRDAGPIWSARIRCPRNAQTRPLKPHTRMKVSGISYCCATPVEPKMGIPHKLVGFPANQPGNQKKDTLKTYPCSVSQRRRHHCRSCGRLFCERCCPYRSGRSEWGWRGICACGFSSSGEMFFALARREVCLCVCLLALV